MMNLDEIEARANAAMRGPWEDRDGQLLASPDTDDIDIVLSCCNMDDQTLAFVAHAREDVPELIAEVRRLRGAITELCNLLHGTDT